MRVSTRCLAMIDVGIKYEAWGKFASAKNLAWYLCGRFILLQNTAYGLVTVVTRAGSWTSRPYPLNMIF